jgi:hypothetical protein
LIRAPISVERCLAVTLAKLGSCGELRNLSELFGMARSTVCITVRNTCKAIAQHLSDEVKFPQGADLNLVMDSFYRNHSLPGVCGALDGTHIPIKAPAKNARDYFNRKHFYSVVLQAVVDHKKKFTNLYFGWPGSVHDARVWANSPLCQICENGFFNANRFKIPGTETTISPYLVADPAYPLKNWIMKPFTGVLSEEQLLFNKMLSACRIYIEHAFGMLKGRWRCLLKTNDSNLTNIKLQVIACCILHNICQDIQDEYLHDWDDNDGLSYYDNSINISQSPTDSRELRELLVNWCNNLQS